MAVSVSRPLLLNRHTGSVPRRAQSVLRYPLGDGPAEHTHSNRHRKSGFGFTGGRSRCFTFWQEFQKCYSVADHPSECVPQKDDYLECLHHGKEIARAKQVKEHYIHHEIKKAKEQREKGEQRATGGVMRLGLIDSDSGSEGSQEKGSSDKK